MDPGQRERQETILRERIVPMVAAQPGFIRGAWARETGGDRHVSFITFDGEEAAKAFVAVVRANAPAQASAGVANDEPVVVELVAEA